ncbi:MAG: glucose-1-phosphate adenylyltransferase, partial [Sporomusaceae bacterium]|nr:glucose-1-phosphate adenylyltransferase [Sporomusaceae bacterium]
YHKAQNADATIAVIEVPWEEASRFGIMNTDKKNRIVEFDEKPKEPRSNLASMGIYVFNWPVLKTYLEEDAANPESSHDFGKDIIPQMLGDNRNMVAHRFQGYWKDVGTVESYWEASMDLVADEPRFDIHDPAWKIYSVNPSQPPQYIAPESKVNCSLISEGSRVFGTVENSVIFPGVYIGPGAVVKQSIVMPYAVIGSDAVVDKTIVGRKTIIENGARVGGVDESKRAASVAWFSGITLIGDNTVVKSDTKIKRNIVFNRGADGAMLAPFGS